MLLKYTGAIPKAVANAAHAVSNNSSVEPDGVRPIAGALREREWVYIPDPGLIQAVNIALLLEQPLLVTGEPGTGKTQLAYAIAAELGLGEVLRFDTKSSSTYRDLFYTFDSLRSFRDAQNQVRDKANLDYITWNALGRAILLANPYSAVQHFIRGFVHPGGASRSLVLIDEVDKAPRDFPNDILREVEQMCFNVPELDDAHLRALPGFRPVVIITSNSERQLPAAFLRRCVYHHIPFPDKDRLRRIVSERLGENLPQNGKLLTGAVELFYELRADSLNLRKRPSTSELLSWIVALSDDFGNPHAELASKPDFVIQTLGCLIKDPEDLLAAEKKVRQWLSTPA